jgi:dihydrofolate synthase / folylpolyglutamate synthase
MGYEDAIAHLEALGVDAMKSLRPSTERIEALMEALNHPERNVPAIHITGTNGKTSTARIAASLLRAAGLSVATYTSPHLQSVRERLVLGGEPISESEFGDVFDHVLPYVELIEDQLGQRVSYFELLTAMFFSWAAEVANGLVVEVGLGGKWDATNVVPSTVAVVTNVGLDHTAMLGSDRITIAKEKVGIIKPESTVVTAERTPDVLAVITDEADGVGAQAAILGRDFDLIENKLAFGGRYLSFRTGGRTYEGVFLPLHGGHQAVNAATALEAAARFLPAHPFDHALVTQGLEEVRVPGRLEQLARTDDEPAVVLDVAHNPDGMSALTGSLLEAFAFDKVHFVVGILGDKDHKGMLLELTRIPCSIVFTEAESVRSTPIADLSATASELGLEHRVVPRVSDAVDDAVRNARAGELVCITGSHYVVGEARTHLGLRPST